MVIGSPCDKKLLSQCQQRLAGGGSGVSDMGRLKIRLETDEWVYEEYDIE
jgi:hypothetical protein